MTGLSRIRSPRLTRSFAVFGAKSIFSQQDQLRSALGLGEEEAVRQYLGRVRARLKQILSRKDPRLAAAAAAGGRPAGAVGTAAAVRRGAHDGPGPTLKRTSSTAQPDGPPGGKMPRVEPAKMTEPSFGASCSSAELGTLGVFEFVQ